MARNIGMRDEEWRSAKIEQLTRLWNRTDPQLSTAEIARQMGSTKNAVAGKAHRLNLPARPSPIRRAGESRPSPAPLMRKQPTLPPVASVALPPVLMTSAAMMIWARQECPGVFEGRDNNRGVHARINAWRVHHGLRPVLVLAPPRPVRQVALPGPVVLVEAPVVVVRPPAPPAPPRPAGGCMWPMWGDRERAPRPPLFCGKAQVPGRAYCRVHATRGYVRVQDRVAVGT